MDIGKLKGSKVRDAMEFPKWMVRVQFGSETLPVNPCVLGDAQPDLINVLLLSPGSNLARIIKNFRRNYCGPVEELWRQHQSHSDLRIDLDPKIPFLGEDEHGNLIERDEHHLKVQYQRIGKPGQAGDLGEDGFIRSYRGSLIFKELATYVLEPGYTPDDFRAMSSSKGERLSPKDTKEEEEEKVRIAQGQMEDQSIFMRTVIAGTFGVNAAYFFRIVDYANTIFLDPLDLVCACRSFAHDFSERNDPSGPVDGKTHENHRRI
jgi:hypothetical protein